MSRLDQYSGETFRGEVVQLDGRRFESCSFVECEMRYSGGDAPALVGCSFGKCTWSFSAEAANTLAFLSGMYNGGMDALVESTFQSVKDSSFVQTQSTNGGLSESKQTGRKAHPLVFRIPKIFKKPKR